MGRAQPPTRLKIVTRYATVGDFIHGFCRAVGHGHVMVGFKGAHPFDSLWRFTICLANGTPVFEGVGRLEEIIPGRDEESGVGARLALEWLDSESSAMHRALLRARGEQRAERGMFARGTLPPFEQQPRLPLPAPDIDEGESEKTCLHDRRVLEAVVPRPPVQERSAGRAVGVETAPVPALVASAARRRMPLPSVLRAAALVLTAAAFSFAAVAFWF